MAKVVNKVWGDEHWVVNREYAGKKMVLHKGKQCSLHFHKNKDETFYVIKGKLLLENNGERIVMEPGDSQLILPYEAHRFTGLSEEPAEIIEFSTHHFDDEDCDNFRVTPSKILKSERTTNPNYYITGNRGYLGRALTQRFSSMGISVSGSDIEFIDITKAEIVDDLEYTKPEAVIHAAALSNWLTCENNPDLAKEINVNSTKKIAEYCKANDVPLIYISTDFIFSGKKGNYSETDNPDPINIYGKTKAMAEDLVRGLNKHIIIRAGTFYGVSYYVDRPVFAHKVIRKLTKGEEYNIAIDEFSNPTLISDLADVIHNLVQAEQYGTWHTGGQDRIDKYTFANKIAEIFNLDKGLIRKSSIKELGYDAKRPQDVSLSMQKLAGIDISTGNIEIGLKTMKRDYNKMQKYIPI